MEDRQAVVRIGRRALKNGTMVAVAVASLIAIYAFDVPFPLIVLAAGLIGYIGGDLRINSNATLPTCSAEALRTAVSENGGNTSITGNDDDAICN
jgi:chromate transport protein ChrA